MHEKERWMSKYPVMAIHVATFCYLFSGTPHLPPTMYGTDRSAMM